MSIEIGSKWVKDGEVYTVSKVEEVLNPRNDTEILVWFSDGMVEYYATTQPLFLEQYKPYEPVYEYQYFYQYKTTQSANSRTHEYYKNDEEFCRKNNIQQIDYQRLDFTKRERKQ